MIKIYSMTCRHKFWLDTIKLAENCTWSVGPFLAKTMKINDLKSWERVFAAVVDGKIAGFCTLAEKDELPDEFEFSPFVGFVFVKEEYRGNRLSEKLIDKAIKYAKTIGYEKVYIMSGEIGLYEKYGFTKIGVYKTKYNTMDQLFFK